MRKTTKTEGKWKYYRTVEEMGDEEISRRTKEAMSFEIGNKIRPIHYIGKEELTIEYVYPELQSRCPMTGLKDIYKINIKFIPDKIIPELKSLKFYFVGYEELPITHEHLAAKIYKDFKKIIKPRKLAILLCAAPRGEITTTIAVGDKELLKFSRPPEEGDFVR